MGRDKHFPETFARLHQKHRTPHIALLTCSAFVVAFGSVGIVKFAVSVAASGDDGRNVIAALQAKRLGMTQVIAIVSDPD